MSLILKGIDLPKDNVLRIEIHPNGTVWEEGREWIKHSQSAIQIPKGHGKIGDIDYIEDNIVEYGDLPTEYLNTDFVISALEDAPYYLEAEEADENQV